MMAWMDVHCHILPDVDDGAENFLQAMELLGQEYGQGVRSIILTPHFRLGYFETSREHVRRRFERLQNMTAAAIPELALFLGCEFHRQEGMTELLDADKSYALAGSSYVLTEFSGMDTMNVIKGYATKLLTNGYRPVIAHAERYPALRSLENVRYLIDAGAYIQMNAGSILGREGYRTKLFCRQLLKEQMVHLIGSDAHDLKRRKPCMGKCTEHLQKILGAQETQRLLSENPMKILTNEYI